MTDNAGLGLSLVGFMLTWTTSVVLLATWLAGKFRGLEKIIYHEMEKHRVEDDRQFRTLSTKIQRLEIKAFGFTESPLADGMNGSSK